jgi:pimeloyl-ACP methyl ester carboxylesterase
VRVVLIKTPIVFLHGVTRCGACFTPLFPFFGNFEVHAPDARGHGVAPRANGYRVADYVPDAIEFLDEHVLEPAVLYGHSMGAMVAAAVAARIPDRIRGLILEDPPFHTMGERLAGTPLHVYFSRLRELAGCRDPIADLARRLGELQIPSSDGASNVRMRETRDAATLRFMARCLRDLDPAVLDPVIAGQWLTGYDIGAVCSALTAPVLLLQSDPMAGGMLTMEDATRLEKAAADCARVFLAGTGHQAHWLNTPMVVRAVTAFLASLE